MTLRENLLGIAARNRRGMALLVAFQLLAAACGAFEPLVIQRLFGAIVTGVECRETLFFVRLFGALAFLYLFRIGAQALASRNMTEVTTRVHRQLRMAFFSKISRLPVDYFRAVHQGEFVARFNTDLSQVERFLGQQVPQILFHGLTALALFAVLLLSCDRLLVLATVLLLILSSLLVMKLNVRQAHHARAHRRQEAEMNRIFDETVQGIDTLKLFTAESRQARRFRESTEAFGREAVKSGRIQAGFFALINAVTQYGNLLVLGGGVLLFLRHGLTLDEFFLFFLCLGLFQRACGQLLEPLGGFQPVRVSLKNLQDLFDRRDEGEGVGAGGSGPPGASSEVELENVTFGYAEGRPVFSGLNLRVGRGETLRVTGPSGRGKTTLINLLLRFYEPWGGRIRIDGRDIRTLPLAELRSRIAVVTQDHFIFEETLRENLSLARPEADDAELEDALRRASLEDWFRGLPQGLDTRLGSRGRTISGGERQRLCIARALLKNSPLLILDEPFANLDPEAKSHILRVIGNCKGSITTIIISHQVVENGIADRTFALPGRNGALSTRRGAERRFESCTPA